MTTAENALNSASPLSIAQRENFIENLAHDLKSSVYSQINALNIIISDEKYHYDDMHLDILKHLMTSNIYMRDVILNVLSNFKIQHDKLKLEKTNRSMEETLDFAIKSISYMFKEKNQTLKISCPNEIFATYDEIEIRRVLINLLSNASKYSSTNSLIEIIIKKENDFISVEIINEGKIEFKNTDDVFKMYETESKKRKLRGSGLGLYISKKIIEAHRGTINAKNLDNKKVVFTFKIPV